MDLKEFVKTVLIQVDAAVEEAGQVTSRNISFSQTNNARTVEFDIAVTAENVDQSEGGGKIKVLQLADIGGKGSREVRNSTVSRITFGVEVSKMTKPEQDDWDKEHGPGVVKARKPSRAKFQS